MSRLEQRVALVTGASRGIGRETARQLAQLGARVAILSRSPAEVRRLAEEVVAQGGQALPIVADMASHAGVRQAVAQVVTIWGNVEILINNAAVMPLGPLAESDPGEWRYTIEVNLIGAYEAMRAVLPDMLRRRWGRIVNVSSAVGQMRGMVNRSAYACSKAALDRLTVAAADEVAGSGVTVNGVYPGLTDTAMQAQLREAPVEIIGAPQQAFVRERFRRGELHRPAEVGRLIAAVVLSDLQGQIVGMDDAQGKALLSNPLV